MTPMRELERLATRKTGASVTLPPNMSLDDGIGIYLSQLGALLSKALAQKTGITPTQTVGSNGANFPSLTLVLIADLETTTVMVWVDYLKNSFRVTVSTSPTKAAPQEMLWPLRQIAFRPVNAIARAIIHRL